MDLNVFSLFLVIFHQRTIFAIVLKEEEPRHIVAIVMIIYVYVAKTPIAEQKVWCIPRHR